MDAQEIKTKLCEDIDAVVKYLLPAAVKRGSNYLVGNIEGDKGDSMSIRTSGDIGKWTDFHTGQTGDIIDLWQAVQKKNSFVEALEDIKKYYNITSTYQFTAKKEKEYTRPTIKLAPNPPDKVMKWLTGREKGERHISKEVVERYKVTGEGDSVVFPFYNTKGELVNFKKRNIYNKKDMIQGTNPEPILFGWQAIRPEDRIVIITEGEIDALSYAHYGYPALSVPAGGGKKQSHWIEREYENLLRFEKIYISMDMDESGQIALAEIIDRLGRHRCAIIDLDAKDANAILCTGVIEKSYFDNYIEAARYLDPDELRNAAEYKEDVWKYVQNPDMLGSKLPFIDTHPDVGIRKAELSIWSGFNGSGKTTVLSLVANELMAQGEKFCIASMEIKPVVLLAKMSKQVANRGYEMIDKPHHDRIFEWFNDKLWLFDVVGTTKSDTILEVFAYARKRYGVTQFIIDSLMKCGIASDDYKGQKAFVDKLCDFKNEHNVHIHLVAHSRKLESEDKEVGKMDIKGTGDITDLADNIFITWRNKKKEDEKRKPEHLRDEKIIKQPDAILSCVKQRNGNGDEGKYGLTFDKYSNRYYGKDDVFLLESPYVR